MSGGRHGSGRDEDPEPGHWADSLGDVQPLAGRHERVTEPPGRPPAEPLAAAESTPTEFVRPDPTEPLLGYASGIQEAQWRRLRQGRLRPERSVDLHGLRSEPARRRCLAAVEEAVAAGERCLLVVHGKGLRSQRDPRLRTALPTWLADPRLADAVLAFAPARPEDGGAGATYVLLRRRRAD